MSKKANVIGGVLAGLAIVGVGLLIRASLAATAVTSLEAESGTVASGASVVADTSASGSKAILFSQAAGGGGTGGGTGGGGGGAGGTVLPTGYDQPSGPSGSFTLKLNDNFDGSTLNSNYWSSGWMGQETQPVQNQETACYLPSQISLSGGILHLTSIKQNTTCSKGTNPHPYATGGINTYRKLELSYGFFEARLKLPATSAGQIYNWPAWWLDTTGQWPDGGEIDIMEGLMGQAKASYHGPVGAGSTIHLATMPAGTDFTQFHTYAAEWKPSTVTIYYDGKQVGTYTSATNVVSNKKFLILGNQMRTQTPMIAPADMQVDYVRVWQR